MGQIYERLQKVSSETETNDCAVIALAVVTGRSYPAVHEALAAAGREHQDGTARHLTRKAIKALGWRIRREWTGADIGLVVGSRKPKMGMALENPEAWELLPDMLLFCEGHVAGLRNGIVEDWTADTGAVITSGWELEREGDQVILGRAPPPVIYLRKGRQ